MTAGTPSCAIDDIAADADLQKPLGRFAREVDRNRRIQQASNGSFDISVRDLVQFGLFSQLADTQLQFITGLLLTHATTPF
jgi:hypothetical protein